MLDKYSIDGIGMLLAKLRKDFDLPLYEVTEAAEEVFGRRPWKRIIQGQERIIWEEEQHLIQIKLQEEEERLKEEENA